MTTDNGTPPKFLWKGFSESLSTILSIAMMDDQELDLSNPFTEEDVTLVITIFDMQGKHTIGNFLATVPGDEIIEDIKSGELIKQIESVALEMMYEVAVTQRKEGATVH